MITVATILYNINKSSYFENKFEYINKNNINLYFIFIGNKKGETYYNLKEKGAAVFFIPYNKKYDLPIVFIKLIYILLKNYPKIIHCHLLWANILGLTAGKLLFIKKRIYTRHHSSYHHKYAENGIFFDIYSNYLATDIISISNVVKEILEKKENVPLNKISVIYHGFDFSKYKIDKNIGQEYRVKLGIDPDKIVVGFVSRYINWKRVDLIIEAFKNLLSTHSNIHLLLANGTGPETISIRTKLESLPKGSFTEVEFENDQDKLYNSFDVFVHIPEDRDIEAFGQVYIEAIAYKKPMVITLSGIANELNYIESDFLKIVPYNNIIEITKAVDSVLHKIKNKVNVDYNYDLSLFEIRNHMKKIEELYAK